MARPSWRWTLPACTVHDAPSSAPRASRRLAHEALAVRDGEAEVGEEAVQPERGEEPPLAQAVVAGREGDDGEHGRAVGRTDRLEDLDSARTAVALDLAPISVDHDGVQAPVGEQRIGERVQRRERFAREACGVATQAQADVPVRVAVAEKEPLVGAGDRPARRLRAARRRPSPRRSRA